jgi:UDPglucose--hexose-1-phosphate uridylyltransferase
VPEFRTDWLTGRTVLVAENRASRPNEFGEGALGRHAADCPFCPGQEHRTPPPVYESRDAEGRWQVRVVPNKFPAVMLPGDQPMPCAVPPAAAGPQSTNVAESSIAAPAIGAHEVIIESARHVSGMSALSVDELEIVLHAYAARLRHWRADGRFSYALMFKNQGHRAGASLGHVHSQLIVLPNAPPAVCAETERAEREFAERRSCPYCRLIDEERSCGTRIVHESDAFVAFCPFASWQPFEVWLFPAVHSPSFEDSPPATLDRLAETLHRLLARVESVVPYAAYNLLLRTMPWQGCDAASSHWRIEILPRSTGLAGLELGAGVFINSVAPEHTAVKLRSS